MAFFGIGSQPDDADVHVAEFHINVWCLPAVGRRRLFVEVGIMVAVRTDQIVNELRVALPCSASECKDIGGTLLEEKFARLLFGRDVQQIKDRVIFFDSGSQRRPLRVIATHSCECIAELSGDGFSVWKIGLTSALPTRPVDTSEYAYLRLMFQAREFRSAWRWHRSLLGPAAATVDLRVADLRGRGPSDAWNQLRFLQVDKVMAFVVIPNHLAVRETHGRHYTRGLETEQWGKYLRRRMSLRRSVSYAIHQWRSQGAVSTNSPFHLYAALEPDRALGLRRMACLFIAVLLASFVAKQVDLISAISALESTFLSNWTVVASLGASGFVAWLLSKIAIGRQALGAVRRVLDMLDNVVYKSR